MSSNINENADGVNLKKYSVACNYAYEKTFWQ